MDCVQAKPELTTSFSLNGLVPFLGVPGYILTTFSPYIGEKARKHPLLFKSIGAALVVLSTLPAVGRYLKSWFSAILTSCMSSVEIRQGDTLSTAFARWLHETGHVLRCRNLSGHSAAHLRKHSHGPVWWSSKHKGSKLVWYDFQGPFYFWHNWRLFRVQNFQDNDTGMQRTWIQTVGFSTKPIKQILKEALQWRLEDQASRLTNVSHAQRGYLNPLTIKRARPLSTIDLPDSVIQPLIDDIAKFLADGSEAQYAARGVPYRRGYLFHGPPGTGKSSLTAALAGHFNLDIQTVSLADPEMNDTRLLRVFNEVANPSIILLEDIDSAGLTREIVVTSSAATSSEGTSENNSSKTEKSSEGKVTLSGFLNALDGIAAPEDCIVVMTTNAPEALDPALIRPGRIDYIVGFHNADMTIARKSFLRLTNLEDKAMHNKLAEDFAAKVPEGRLSPAELQGYLIGCVSCPQAALVGAQAWIEMTLADKAKPFKQTITYASTAEEPTTTTSKEAIIDQAMSTDKAALSSSNEATVVGQESSEVNE